MTALEVSRPGSAAALYATPRNPRLATYGPNVDAMAAALGHPNMPWQSQVATVAGEVRDDGTPRYSVIVCTTQRQAGKSTLLEAVLCHRCMTQPDYRAWYTAQTGQDAGDMWREWQRNISTALPNQWHFRESNGSETATYKPTGSFIRPFPPKPDALHGKQSDMAALDEVWNLTLTDGAALTQAVVPTQATRKRAQLWIVSTAGDESSLWFRDWVQRGRESLADPATEIAYFEWATPIDAPWDDPATWAAYHPAYGHTIDERAMRKAMDAMGETQFRRAFLNQWPAAETSWRAGWAALASGDRIPEKARVYLAADAQLDHRAAAFTAAAVLPDGRIAVEVIDHRPGVEWVLDRARELARRHHSRVLIQRTGPLGYLVPELEAAGVPVQAVTQDGYADAAVRLRTLITERRIAHADDPRLSKAVDAVDVRAAGDRSVWKRRDATVDICPLVAASLAAWQAARPAIKPAVFSA